MKKELIALAIATAVMSAGCSNTASNSVETTTEASMSEVATEGASVDIVEKAKEILPDYVTPGVEIANVELKDKKLYITVDLSKYNGQFSLDAVAEAAVSEITDPILSLDESYYKSWDTMTLNFGEQGHVTFDKSTVKDDGAGKYFSYDGSILQK